MKLSSSTGNELTTWRCHPHVTEHTVHHHSPSLHVDFMKHSVRCTTETILQGKLVPAPLPCTDNAYKLLPNAEKTKTPGRIEMGGQVITTNAPFISGYMDLILGWEHVKAFDVLEHLIFIVDTDADVCLKGFSRPDPACALWHFRSDSNGDLWPSASGFSCLITSWENASCDCSGFSLRCLPAKSWQAQKYLTWRSNILRAEEVSVLSPVSVAHTDRTAD